MPPDWVRDFCSGCSASCWLRWLLFPADESTPSHTDEVRTSFAHCITMEHDDEVLSCLTAEDHMPLGAEANGCESEDETGGKTAAAARGKGRGRKGASREERAKRAAPGQGAGRKASGSDDAKNKILKTSGAGIKAKDQDPRLHKRCKVCKLYFPKELMPDKAMCYEDARGYDGLTRLAARQKEEKWWDETKNDEKLLAAALKAYKKACPDSGHGKSRGGAAGSVFKIAEYKETWGRPDILI